MTNVKRVATINTNVGRHCLACDAWQKPDTLEESVNHYLQAHGWVLVHIGEQTYMGDGNLQHHVTVAVVGEPATRQKGRPADGRAPPVQP
jgi:hypothetical protein